MPDQTPSAVTDRTIGQYLAALASSEPAPGGGSASGVVGALGAGLGLMALALTDLDGTDAASALRDAQGALEALRDRFTDLSQQDERAYRAYLDASALPRRTEEEKSVRRIAMQDALKNAAGVPLAICEASADLVDALAPVHKHGNKYLRSDVQVGQVFAGASFAAARVLVETNLALIKDAVWVQATTARLEELGRRVVDVTSRV